MSNEDFSLAVGRQERGRQGMERTWVLYASLAVLMGVLVARGFFLQVVQGGVLRGQAEGNRVTARPQMATRGILYDRTGVPLVENAVTANLVFDPAFLPNQEHEAPLVERLPELVATLTPDDVRSFLTQTREAQRVTTVRRALPHDEVIHLTDALDTLPGVRLAEATVRSYRRGYPLAHVVGYTGAVTAEELVEDTQLLPQDIVGKAGLESWWDDDLRGQHGASYEEVDAAGHPQKVVGEEAAIAGWDVHLALDVELQEFIYSTLAERAVHVNEERGERLVTAGAVVALDPLTGGIRALVSFPSFDPNTLSQPHHEDDVQAILTDSARPLFNRAVSGMYPPGSTIKPLLAAAGLAEEVITPQTTVRSTGGIRIGPWRFPDWRAGGHGVVDVRGAIADSVNTFFYLLAGGDESQSGLGVRTIGNYLRLFSWGEATGIDVPVEATGLLPTPEWKEKTKSERWYIGDTYHLGIGQGDVLVTPLQVAAATAAIANGGAVHTPRVAVRQQRGDEVVDVPLLSRELGIADRHLAVVREGMRETVTMGSGRLLANLPLALAGKTGTAQASSVIDDTHAWFTSFGPYEDPQLVLTVLLERGGAGDIDAVPVARDVWNWWDENRRGEL